MVDKDNMSVEEMLAYCRQTDGDGAAPSEEAAAAETPPAEASESKPAASKPDSSPPSKPAAEMSVEEMLAAARGDGGGEKEPDAQEATEKKAPEKKAPEKKAPAKEAAGGGVSPQAAREMSVEEMMAAARGEGAAKSEPQAKPAGKSKPADKTKPAAKAKPADKAKPSKPAPSGPKDTGSILAGGQRADKPGPMSKAEAEKRKSADSKPKAAPRAAPAMPERPAYLRRSAEPAGDDEGGDRRSFFAAFGGVILGSSMAVGFASLTVTNLLWVLGLARFMFPNILIEPPTSFKVGFPEEYAAGQVETKYKAQFGVWVVRYEYQGLPQIYALKSVCTHLGCTPNWLEGEQKFKCPCHGSGFYKDGINFEGPAPRPLERYAIRVAADGQLEVDKSLEFNEEKGQWVDPASYVKV